MIEHKDLRDELLGQNGLDPGKISDEHWRQLQWRSTQEERRVRRIRLAAMILWLVVIMWPIAMVIASRAIRAPQIVDGHKMNGGFGPLLVGWWMLVGCALGCSVLAYRGSRHLNMSRIQAALLDIARQLRELSEAKKR